MATTDTEQTTLSAEKKEVHDQILKTALQLFTQKGYFNTSVANIKEEADVSTGSIYHHFKNKESIAEALYTDIQTRLLRSIDDIRRKHKTARDRTLAITELLFDLTEQAPEAIHFLILSQHQEFLPGEKPMNESKAFQRLRDILASGMKAGEVRHMDAELASAAFYGVIFRTIEVHQNGLLNKPLESYLNDTWSAAWRTISAS